MTGTERPPVPTTADDVDHDFDATASPPPGSDQQVRGLVAGHVTNVGADTADPGHLAENDEWADIVAHARRAQS